MARIVLGALAKIGATAFASLVFACIVYGHVTLEVAAGSISADVGTHMVRWAVLAGLFATILVTACVARDARYDI